MTVNSNRNARGYILLCAASVMTLATVAGTGQANAQLGAATTTADPGRASQQVQQPQAMPKVSPDITVRAAKPQGVPKGADKIRFTLRHIAFPGASVYTADQLHAVYADRLGKTITLADLYAVAADITAKYRNDGYILTQVVVPPQTIESGDVKLQVVEGYVNQVQVQKTDPNAPIDMENVRHYASQIEHGGPLNARDLERQLLIINDLPGVTARGVLSPSATTPGAADLLVELQYDPLDGLLSVDNFGSRYLGPLQLGAAATLNSVLGQNEAITAQVVTAPQDTYELAYGSLGYEQPIGIYGTKLHVSGNVTDTDPGWDLKQFDVRGRSYFGDIGVTHPFIRSRTENLYGRLDFDYRKVKSSNNVEDTRRDRISTLRAGARYEFIDRLVGAAANTADLEVSKGINLLGASSEKGDDNLTRANGDPQFTKAAAEIQRLQRLSDSFNLLLAGRGQIASHALLSSEQFGLGGINYGRGYDPSEITGDDGLAGKIELQWKEPYHFNTRVLNTYQLFTFYDIGEVWNKDATTSSLKKDSLASLGGGLRFNLINDFDAGVGVAFPLTRDVQTRNDKSTKYYFNLSKRF